MRGENMYQRKREKSDEDKRKALVEAVRANVFDETYLLFACSLCAFVVFATERKGESTVTGAEFDADVLFVSILLFIQFFRFAFLNRLQ